MAGVVPMGNEVDEMAGLASFMQHKMEARPKLLSPSAGRRRCCIFRVPRKLLKLNEEAYHPYAVSIGPYHHGDEHLQMLEEYKWRFLKSLLARCQPHGIHLQDLIDAILPEEERIRESYSECIDEFGKKELVLMMVLDGCFIIETLSIKGKLVERKDDHNPIFNVVWILPAVMLDLLQLENQIPYFVLEKLFEITRVSRAANNNGTTTTTTTTTNLAGLALNFFNNGMQRPSYVMNRYIDRINNQTAPPKHLLDLYRISFVIPIYNSSTHTRYGDGSPLQLIQSTQMLRTAGIRFRMKKSAESFLEISFNKGILEIPFITIEKYMHIPLLNLVAFEQCYYHHPQIISSYIQFMGCLINSSADSEYLQRKQIIDKSIGTHDEVVRVFNEICKSIDIYAGEFYLYTVCQGINRYCSNNWRIGWAGVKRKYFGAPWAWIAALGALLGLILTATQAVFSVLSYANSSTPTPH